MPEPRFELQILGFSDNLAALAEALGSKLSETGQRLESEKRGRGQQAPIAGDSGTLSLRAGRALVLLLHALVWIVDLWAIRRIPAVSPPDEFPSHITGRIQVDYSTSLSSPSRRVTCSRSRNSSSGMAYLREIPVQSLKVPTLKRADLCGANRARSFSISRA
jgi:hypothetical protein